VQENYKGKNFAYFRFVIFHLTNMCYLGTVVLGPDKEREHRLALRDYGDTIYSIRNIYGMQVNRLEAGRNKS
jgi:hypothetical protein